MLQAFLNMWKIAELRSKLIFTMAMLAIYRIGFFIPLPAIDQAQLKEFMQRQTESGTATGDLISFVGIFTGGTFSQSTIFGLGIMPYISAAIIFQLLGTVLPSLQALQKEGAAGQQKITEYTRYATVAICLLQSVFWLVYLNRPELGAVYPEYQGTALFWISGIVGLTAGTIFLMWLGEQVDKYGIGNGISLIITAGIVASMPKAIATVVSRFHTGDYGFDTIIFLLVAFVSVTAGAIIITQGQRRIPIQQAKRTRGRKMYGGQRSYLPLRVNHGGVMPIIFASALMMFPRLILGAIDSAFQHKVVWISFLDREFAMMGGYLYTMVFIAMIYFFAYFWTSVQFQPKEMATQLRDHGSFIPGLRPGPRTADYLETVMERITYVGAGFLAVIAVIPTLVSRLFGIDFYVSAFLGGTGLLITVSVMLDMVQRIEAAMMMRNYPGFLSGDGGGKRIRGTRHTT